MKEESYKMNTEGWMIPDEKLTFKGVITIILFVSFCMVGLPLLFTLL